MKSQHFAVLVLVVCLSFIGCNKVTYVPQEPEMSENMKLAASVAATAMIANASPFKNNFKVTDILALLDSMQTLKSDPERAEFRSLVAKMKD